MSDLVGREVTTRRATVNPSARAELQGRLVRTFSVGRLEYAVIERAGGGQGTALLRDVTSLDPDSAIR